MKLVVIGVNHKTAPIALRERLAFGDDLAMALTSFRTHGVGAVIISTCNRSEIYACFEDEVRISDTQITIQGVDPAYEEGMEDPPSVHGRWLQQWLADFKQVDSQQIAPYLYMYHDERALNHWLRVATGLDSMILGEPQILGQIRQAVAMSQNAQALGGQLGWLTQQVFAAAKSVRRDTSLGKQAVSLGYATAKLVTQIYDDPSRLTLLIVAAGEMNRLVAHNVAALGMTRVVIANRSPKRAQLLADELSEQARHDGRTVQIDLVGLESLDEVLMQADVVSSCSGSMHTLIDVAMVKRAMKARRHKPMLMVDLAVPRDIDSDAGRLDNVYLYSIDDLEHVIAGNIAARRQAAVEAELMVSQLTSRIEQQVGLVNAGKHIHDYRSLAKTKSEALLALAKSAIADGKDPDAVLDEFAHAMLQTLTHPPSRLIRHIATTKDADSLAHVVRGLKSYREQ